MATSRVYSEDENVKKRLKGLKPLRQQQLQQIAEAQKQKKQGDAGAGEGSAAALEDVAAAQGGVQKTTSSRVRVDGRGRGSAVGRGSGDDAGKQEASDAAVLSMPEAASLPAAEYRAHWDRLRHGQGQQQQQRRSHQALDLATARGGPVGSAVAGGQWQHVEQQDVRRKLEEHSRRTKQTLQHVLATPMLRRPQRSAASGATPMMGGPSAGNSGFPFPASARGSAASSLQVPPPACSVSQLMTPPTRSRHLSDAVVDVDAAIDHISKTPMARRAAAYDAELRAARQLCEGATPVQRRGNNHAVGQGAMTVGPMASKASMLAPAAAAEPRPWMTPMAMPSQRQFGATPFHGAAAFADEASGAAGPAVSAAIRRQYEPLLRAKIRNAVSMAQLGDTAGARRMLERLQPTALEREEWACAGPAAGMALQSRMLSELMPEFWIAKAGIAEKEQNYDKVVSSFERGMECASQTENASFVREQLHQALLSFILRTKEAAAIQEASARSASASSRLSTSLSRPSRSYAAAPSSSKRGAPPSYQTQGVSSQKAGRERPLWLRPQGNASSRWVPERTRPAWPDTASLASCRRPSHGDAAARGALRDAAHQAAGPLEAGQEAAPSPLMEVEGAAVHAASSATSRESSAPAPAPAAEAMEPEAALLSPVLRLLCTSLVKAMSQRGRSRNALTLLTAFEDKPSLGELVAEGRCAVFGNICDGLITVVVPVAPQQEEEEEERTRAETPAPAGRVVEIQRDPLPYSHRSPPPTHTPSTPPVLRSSAGSPALRTPPIYCTPLRQRGAGDLPRGSRTVAVTEAEGGAPRLFSPLRVPQPASAAVRRRALSRGSGGTLTTPLQRAEREPRAPRFILRYREGVGLCEERYGEWYEEDDCAEGGARPAGGAVDIFGVAGEQQHVEEGSAIPTTVVDQWEEDYGDLDDEEGEAAGPLPATPGNRRSLQPRRSMFTPLPSRLPEDFYHHDEEAAATKKTPARRRAEVEGDSAHDGDDDDDTAMGSVVLLTTATIHRREERERLGTDTMLTPARRSARVMRHQKQQQHGPAAGAATPSASFARAGAAPAPAPAELEATAAASDEAASSAMDVEEAAVEERARGPTIRQKIDRVNVRLQSLIHRYGFAFRHNGSLAGASFLPKSDAVRVDLSGVQRKGGAVTAQRSAREGGAEDAAAASSSDDDEEAAGDGGASALPASPCEELIEMITHLTLDRRPSRRVRTTIHNISQVDLDDDDDDDNDDEDDDVDDYVDVDDVAVDYAGAEDEVPIGVEQTEDVEAVSEQDGDEESFKCEDLETTEDSLAFMFFGQPVTLNDMEGDIENLEEKVDPEDILWEDDIYIGGKSRLAQNLLRHSSFVQDDMDASTDDEPAEEAEEELVEEEEVVAVASTSSTPPTDSKPAPQPRRSSRISARKPTLY